MVNSNLWSNDDVIYFYFDTDNVVIYPETVSGIDRVFARIHIRNLTGEQSGPAFFSGYTVKSVKAKSAVLISPKKLSSFIEDLKVLVDLNDDGTFKLI